MHFATTAMAFLASAALSTAAKVTFWTLDDVQRTVYFVGNAQVGPVVVNGKANKTVTVPDNFDGNFYAVRDGDAVKPGMLGEINFGSWGGLTYFDVSAIVDPTDHNNVKQMWPFHDFSIWSGCEVFPCDNCYWHPDDVQTKTTQSNHLVTSLGEGSTGLF